MLFLGKAANYSRKDVFKHLFATGSKSDFDELTEEFAKHYGSDSEHVALTNTGRSALAIALKAVLPRDSKVVINGMTCYAVVQAVKAAGLVPIFADINEETLHYDKAELAKTLKKYPDIKAVIIQNTLGVAADIEGIEKFCKQRKLLIIEDLAHCAGLKYPDGREAGTVGVATALSFGKGKAIDTISGGAVILRDLNLPAIKKPTNLPKFSDRARARWYPFFGALMRASYKIHLNKIITGILLKFRWIERSADAKLDIKARLTCWQAKLVLRQLDDLSKKMPLRDFYLVNDREKVLERLFKIGYCFDEIWYDPAVSPARYYDKVHFPEKECPKAVEISKQIINFPRHYKRSELSPALRLTKGYEK